MTHRSPHAGASAAPSADNGDGTYRNPVLHADWSDPDAVRIGEDCYLVASSFHRVPGLPVLHSRDLVEWSIIGHALPRLEPEEAFASPQRGRGVWAPSIRRHAGRLWIFYPDPDRGVFVVSSPEPGPGGTRLEWTRPHLLKGGRGLIDPCPLWDEDGSAYLVHAWAKSRAGFNNRLTAHRMRPDATALLDEGRVIVDGDALPGYRTLEGPKWYRHEGRYWIFAPAGGVRDGWQSAFRSRSVFGPYEERIVLERGDTAVNGPHQGAWVTTEGGPDWFLHFQDKGPFGRVVHLQPMRWTDEGWPAIGEPPGRPVASHAKPEAAGARRPGAAAADDDFTDGIGLQWTWAANPDPAWAEPVPGPRLRLTCAPFDAEDLRRLPNLLERRLPGERFRASTTVRLTGAAAGARAGLTVLGDAYAWIGLERTDHGVLLVHRSAAAEGAERAAAEPVPVALGGDGASAAVAVGVDVTPDGGCRFLAGEPDGPLRSVGPPFAAAAGRWVGAALGLFAAGPPHAPGGAAEFGPVRVVP